MKIFLLIITTSIFVLSCSNRDSADQLIRNSDIEGADLSEIFTSDSLKVLMGNSGSGGYTNMDGNIKFDRGGLYRGDFSVFSKIVKDSCDDLANHFVALGYEDYGWHLKDSKDGYLASRSRTIVKDGRCIYFIVRYYEIERGRCVYEFVLQDTPIILVEQTTEAIRQFKI